MSRTVQQEYARAVKLGDLTADVAQEAVLPILEGMRARLAAPQKRGLRGLFAKDADLPRGLYLWGGVGRGKSMLMDLFVGAVEAPKRRVHFHAFMQEIHAGMHEVRKSGLDDALKPVAEAVAAQARLLAFDELQINDITDAMIVGRLFEQLFRSGVTIVTTSNRAPDSLYEDGLNRQLFLPFIEMLKARMVVHELASPTDYRADTEVYFTPANAVARLAIERLWTELSGGAGEPLVMTV